MIKINKEFHTDLIKKHVTNGSPGSLQRVIDLSTFYDKYAKFEISPFKDEIPHYGMLPVNHQPRPNFYSLGEELHDDD